MFSNTFLLDRATTERVSCVSLRSKLRNKPLGTQTDTAGERQEVERDNMFHLQETINEGVGVPDTRRYNYNTKQTKPLSRQNSIVFLGGNK